MVMSVLHFEKLPFYQYPDVGWQLCIQALPIRSDRCILPSLAFGNNCRVIMAGQAGFDVHPASVQGRSGMPAVSGIFSQSPDFPL